MREVMAERKDQLVDKMERLRLQQDQLLIEREELLRDIELAGRREEEEEGRRGQAVKERERELREQVCVHVLINITSTMTNCN